MDIVRGNANLLVAGLLFIVIFSLRRSRLKLPKNPKQIVTLRLKNQNKSAGPEFFHIAVKSRSPNVSPVAGTSSYTVTSENARGRAVVVTIFPGVVIGSRG